MALVEQLAASAVAVAPWTPNYPSGALLQNRQSSCLSSELSCADGCIPQGANCCDQITGNWCDPGYNCVTSGSIDACCPTGTDCSCQSGEEACGIDCMPSGAVCCTPNNDIPGLGTYCDSGYLCVSDGCQPEGSSFTTTFQPITHTLFPTSSTSHTPDPTSSIDVDPIVSSGLSTAAQVGIGVGCALVGLAIASILLRFCFYRRRRNALARQSETSQWPPAQPQPPTPHTIIHYPVSPYPVQPGVTKSETAYQNTQPMPTYSPPPPTSGAASAEAHSKLGSWSSPAEVSGVGDPAAYRAESYPSYPHLGSAELPASSTDASRHEPTA